MTDSSNTKRTECLEILRRIRTVVGIEDRRVAAVHYTADSLIMLFRHEDKKLYKVEIKEVENVPAE